MELAEIVADGSDQLDGLMMDDNQFRVVQDSNPTDYQVDDDLVLEIVNTLSRQGIVLNLYDLEKRNKKPGEKEEKYRKLAKTDLSTVYPAIQVSKEQLSHCVLKVYNQTAINMFGIEGLKDEGDIQKRCHAAGVSTPQLITHGHLSEGIAFMVMEYIEGENLLDVLVCQDLDDKHLPKNMRRRTPQEILRIVADYAEEIHKIHQAGVVHLDLKPENVLVQKKTDRPFVFDFGSSLYLPYTPKKKREYIMHPRNIIGSLNYAAPEVLFDKEKITPRADQYALAVFLYNMAVGKLPFAKINLNKLAEDYMKEKGHAAFVNAELEDILGEFAKFKQQDLQVSHSYMEGYQIKPGYPNNLGFIIERCGRSDPAKRPFSMAEAVEHLRRLL